jgi:hypothetical protein
VAFLFSLVMVGAGCMARQQEHQKLAGFAAESVHGTGVVTKKFTEVKTGNKLFYNLGVSFTAADGSTYKQSFRIPPAIYHRYGVGSPIPVTYVKSEPFLFHIQGAEPDKSNLDIMTTMANWFAGASILLGASFLIGLYIALMMRRRAGGGEVALHRMSGDPRLTFGTRQARR